MDSLPTTPDRNAGQIEYWNGPVGKRWAMLQERLDLLFAGLTEAAIDQAAPAPGARVLDIGCGCGATVLALARKVGPEGGVLGVDVSAVMVDVARARVSAESSARLLVADAATHPFVPEAFDLAFSRFGVMFFDAPAAAFTNIRRGLRPGAGLFFACWRLFAENPWFAVPYWAAKPHLPEQPPSDPEAPGPFAFADATRVRRILGEAGFKAIGLDRYDTLLQLSGPGRIDEALRFVAEIGPASRALASANESQRNAAEAAIREALAAHDGPEGINLGASLWFVSAKA